MESPSVAIKKRGPDSPEECRERERGKDRAKYRAGRCWRRTTPIDQMNSHQRPSRCGSGAKDGKNRCIDEGQDQSQNCSEKENRLPGANRGDVVIEPGESRHSRLDSENCSRDSKIPAHHQQDQASVEEPCEKAAPDRGRLRTHFVHRLGGRRTFRLGKPKQNLGRILLEHITLHGGRWRTEWHSRRGRGLGRRGWGSRCEPRRYRPRG